MCLAVPLKLVAINGKEGVGEFDGAQRRVRLDFLPQAKLGDHVMVHAGFAFEIVRQEQAEADWDAFLELTKAL